MTQALYAHMNNKGKKRLGKEMIQMEIIQEKEIFKIYPHF
jgi:hypothetical protein